MHDGLGFNEYEVLNNLKKEKNSNKNNYKSFFVFAFLIITLLAGIILLANMVVTKENEYKVIKQFGSIVRVEDEPGLTFKLPLIQNVTTIDKQLLFYDIPRSDVITSDKKTMIVDSYVIWRVVSPEKFIKTLSGSNMNAESRLNTVVYNAIKNTISGMTQDEVIVSRDGNINITVDNQTSPVKIVSLTEAIANNLPDCSDYGIEIVKTEVKVLDLPDENKQAVYTRMISERTNVAASYEAQGKSEAQKIINETDKTIAIMLAEAEIEAERIIADGEAEYMKILSDAYNDESKSEFYAFVRELDATRVSLKTNNGNTLILEKNSPIANIFYK